MNRKGLLESEIGDKNESSRNQPRFLNLPEIMVSVLSEQRGGGGQNFIKNLKHIKIYFSKEKMNVKRIWYIAGRFREFRAKVA